MTAAVIIRATATGWEWLDPGNLDTGIQPGLPKPQVAGDNIPGTPCVLLLPAEQVFLGSVRIVSRNHRQLVQAVPFAVEEQLAEDPELLHFAVFKTDSKEMVQVAAVSRVVLQAALDELQANGLVAICALPDALLLPWRAGDISVLIDAGRALVRYGEYEARAIESEILESWLPLLIGEMETRPEEIRIFGADGTVLPADLPLPCTAEPGEYAMADLMAEYHSGIGFNLLQADFRPQLQKGGSVRWKVPAIAAAVTAALALVVNFTELQNLKSSSAQLDQATESLFRQTFPQIKRLQDPIIQAKRELQRLRGGAAFTQSDFIYLVSGIAASISTRPGLKLTSLRYRNRQMQLELEASSIDELEQLQQAAKSAGLDARLQSARLGSDGVSGTLTLARLPT